MNDKTQTPITDALRETYNRERTLTPAGTVDFLFDRHAKLEADLQAATINCKALAKRAEDAERNLALVTADRAEFTVQCNRQRETMAALIAALTQIENLSHATRVSALGLIGKTASAVLARVQS